MWMWGWKSARRELPASVTGTKFQSVLDSEGFRLDISKENCLLFRRSGSIWTFHGERAPIAIEVRGNQAEIRYDTRWMIGDTRDLAKLLERLLEQST